MRGQEVCFCLCVCMCACPSAAAAGKLLGFQQHPSKQQRIFDRGLQFSSPRETGGFTSACLSAADTLPC